MEWKPFDTVHAGYSTEDKIWVAQERGLFDMEADGWPKIGLQYRTVLASWNPELACWGDHYALLSKGKKAKGHWAKLHNPKFWMPFHEPAPPPEKRF